MAIDFRSLFIGLGVLAICVTSAPNLAHAQAQTMTPELAAANKLLNVLGNLYRDYAAEKPDGSAVNPGVIPSGSGSFTYAGTSCERAGSGYPPRVSCAAGNLVGSCTGISVPLGGEGAGNGLEVSCTIADKSGKAVPVGEPGKTSTAPFVVLSGLSNISLPKYDEVTGTTLNPDTGEKEEEAVPQGEGFCDVPCMLAKLPGMLFSAIAFLFLVLSGFILGLAGTVFNWVVIRTVFQFGTYFGTNEGMLVAWGVIRDIANIGLLFGFIFMGVLLILNVEGGGGHGHGGGLSAKKAIPRLIIFAVLLNFSLFASQAVIDVANAFSASFATLAGEENCSAKDLTTGDDTDAGKQSTEKCANVGIAGKVLKVAGLTALWDTEGLDGKGWTNLIDRPYSYTVSLIMLSIFVLITAMVLLAGAIMLIIRVVILSLLMVTSPIGFAGMAIPKLEGIAGMWWSKLMSQAFFAPVYLLLIFISIKLTEGLMQGNATLANAVIGNEGAGTAGNMQVVMVFLIVIGFMIGSLITASKMGAMGAKFATSSAAGMTVGAAGFVGRRTLGVASGAMANRIASSSWYRNNGVGSRLAYNSINKGATSSLSLRTGLNSATKGFGLDIGNANKNVSHGIHGIEEAEVKKRIEAADKIVAQNSAEKAEEKRLKDAKTLTTNSKARAAALWAEEKKNIQSKINEDSAANTTNAKARLDAIDAKKAEIETLKKSTLLGTTNVADAAREEALLAGLLATHRAETERENADIEERGRALKQRQETHDADISAFDKRVKDLDHQIKGGDIYDPATGTTKSYAGVSGDAVRRQYAKSMEHSGLPWPSVGSHVNHEAAEKILKKLNRSKNDKLIDAIKETAKEDKEADDGHGKKDDHGGGGSDAGKKKDDHAH